MAPKSAAAKAKEVEVEEEVLQAVILADSFNTRFMPLTASTPRVRLLCFSPVFSGTE
jgi:translation initiation factor eIF-2B subunit epsilon